MSKTLGEIREKIDSIDNQLHDLLMERASLVSSVASAKKKEGLQIVQPAREARMMRRLLARHEGVLPRSTIVRIWRELVGSVALLQTGLSVVVAKSDNGGDAFWDMAKDYFGSTVPMEKVDGVGNAISMVKDGKESFAVLPWPVLDEIDPWWRSLFYQNADKKNHPLSILCALPYGREKMGDSDVYERAVVVSEISFMPSEDDVTFVALELSDEVSRTRVMDVMKQSEFDLIGLYSGRITGRNDARIYLLEVPGYHDVDSDIVDYLQQTFKEQFRYCRPVGGYPVVPDVRN